MRKTSFGYMKEFDVQGLLQGKFELMHFDKPGRPHTHEDNEIAVCIHGSGVVVVGDEVFEVSQGTAVEVLAGVSHHMRPTIDKTLSMMIFYRSLTVQKN